MSANEGSREDELIDWASVAIIGEYTTPSGPWLDDYFLVAVLRSGRILECATEDFHRVIPDLERATGIKIELRLCNQTDCASRVIFPLSFVEYRLFDFREEPAGFFKTIKNFGVTEFSKHLTSELVEHLENLGREGKTGR